MTHILLMILRNVLAQALLELHQEENVTQAPSNCNTSGAVWETGKQLFEYIRRQVLANGRTGRVAFDGMGDRMFAEYEVINVHNGAPSVVGNYKYAEVSDVGFRMALSGDSKLTLRH